ncbi:MAG TPA: hypothetical protein VHG52_02110, partial [Thermomicrobiales bacterium]|nr:hypothetical protein [Thermomicrobiales bacterium]
MPPLDVTLLCRNRLLGTVHDVELERFTDILRVREYGTGEIISEPGEKITHVIFPLDGVFSPGSATISPIPKSRTCRMSVKRASSTSCTVPSRRLRRRSVTSSGIVGPVGVDLMPHLW